MDLQRHHDTSSPKAATLLRPARPLANIAEADEAYHIELRVPGVAKDAVELQVDKGVLRLRAEARIDPPAGLRALGREFASSSFERRFRLPDEVDTTRIEAQLVDGILRLVLPKREAVKARAITIS